MGVRFSHVAAVVVRDPHVAVVGAGEQEARLDRRLLQRHDRAVRLGAGEIERDAAGVLLDRVDARESRALLRRIRLDRQVGRDRIQVLAALVRLQHPVAAEVEHLRVVRREEVRRVPVVANLEVGRVLLLLRAQRVDLRLRFARHRLAADRRARWRSNLPTARYRSFHVGLFTRPRSPVLRFVC